MNYLGGSNTNHPHPLPLVSVCTSTQGVREGGYWPYLLGPIVK